ncbi:SulP family inorganic anion transporter [Tichowtungia aerotolerans]|uniref:Sulfate permease n=1 Tax=Tichowtungia aerotolerans TaxID=2697043 RepID=A0A6P1M6A3_9BACT|nr:sulfate permease [Tichowtungia aerotolerans]QHI68134.1 sulfate permease [Tichowtungia aerotolerans]
MLKPKLFSILNEYNRTVFRSDLIAGVTVGIVAVPLAMAFAIAAGLPPERGLFTAVVAGFLISVLGGSRVQIGGPTGAFVVIVSGIVAQHGYAGLATATAMAGLMLVAMGLGRMGGLIRFIPFPVVTGFTSGIAVVIFSTQIKDLFGLQVDALPADFIAKWATYIRHFDTVQMPAAAIGVGTILLVVGVRRLLPRWPALLIGMVAATLVSSGLGLDVETIGSRFGDLPRTLPAPSWVGVSFGEIKALMGPAFTIAILCAIESLLSATVADGMTGGRHRSNMELVAQGAANIGSALFGGIPATGAIARTATNIKSGGKTPVAGMIHAVTLALVLLFFAPVARMIPLAALAGILVVVSAGMSEAGRFVRLLKSPRSDVLVLLTTFFLTVLIDLTVAVEVGIVLAALLFIRRMADVGGVREITAGLYDDPDGEESGWLDRVKNLPAGVVVYEVQGPFFFGAADRYRQLIQSKEKSTRVIILRMRHVPAIDATGHNVLLDLHKQCSKKNMQLVFSGVRPQPMDVFRQTGFLAEVGPENVCRSIDEALVRMNEVLGR